jgi:hypothetical protein
MYPAAGQANFTYYVNGVRYEKTALESVTLAGTPTLYHYFHFADGVLSSSTTRDDASLISNAQVASIYISPSNNRITYLSDERHGISIDGDSLVYANKDGLEVISGFGLTGTAGSENYVSTSAGVLRNADLRIDAPIKTTNKFASRLATDWKISDFGNTLISNKLSILGSVTVDNGGSGYRGATTSAVVQGDGSLATVDLGFSAAPIASVTLTDGGYDYSAGTTAAITGDGTGAVVSVTIPSGFNHHQHYLDLFRYLLE